MLSLEEHLLSYPAAAPGQLRKVICLPKKNSSLEQNHLFVQIIPGRHETCDDGRIYRFTGTVTSETLPASGHKYYLVQLGNMYPLNNPPSRNKNKKHFVALHDTPMIPYKSTHPIVVYIPEDADVLYRIWGDAVSQVRDIELESEALALAPSPGDLVSEQPEKDEGQERQSDSPAAVSCVIQESIAQLSQASVKHEDCAHQLSESSQPHPRRMDDTSVQYPVDESHILERRDSNSSEPMRHNSSEAPESIAKLTSIEFYPSNSKSKRRSSVKHQLPEIEIDETSHSHNNTSSKNKKNDKSHEKKTMSLWSRMTHSSSVSNSSPLANPKDTRGADS